MTDALSYLVDSLLTLYLYVLILRFVMQLARADFRNQIAHAVLTVTNPLIMPLRRILPPIGKIDTASVLSIIVVAAVNIALVRLIEHKGLLNPSEFAVLTAFTLARTFIMFYMGAIFIYVILSFVIPAGYSPAMALLSSVCEPLLRPFRRIIPPIASIDFSPLWAGLLLGVLLRILAQLFAYTIT